MTPGPFELIILWVLPALAVGWLATRRGHNFWLFFAGALLFSWILALIVLLLLGQRAKPASSPGTQ